MLIDCPACARSYHVSPADIDGGRTVICPRCDARWFVGDTDAFSPQSDVPRFDLPRLGPPDRFDATGFPGPSTPRGNMPPPPRLAARLPRAATFTSLALASLALVSLTVGARARIVHLVPRSAMLYRAAGLTVNPRGLDFREVRSERADPSSADIVISGEIRNVAKARVRMPRLAFEVRDASGQTIARWSETAPAKLVGAGRTLAFASTPHAVPGALSRKLGLAAPALFPLWPREGRPARLVLLQARRGARGGTRVLPGAVLHEGKGWSAWADGVLRDGAAISMAENTFGGAPSFAAHGPALRCRETKEGTMVVVAVLYPASGGEVFDHAYYMTNHMPLVHKRWDGMGLQGAEVLRGVPGPDGAKPAFNTMTLLRFSSMDAFKAATEAHGAELFGDIPNFTKATPTVQFSEAG